MSTLLKLTPLNETYDLIEQYRDIKQRIKALGIEEKLLYTELTEGYFKANDKFIFHDRLIASYDDTKRKVIDKVKFEKENPKLIQVYNATILEYTSEEITKTLRLK